MNPNKVNTIQNKTEALRNDDSVRYNEAGGMVFDTSAKEQLYLMSSTWLVGEPKFYESTDNEIISLIHRVAQEDPIFVLDLALFLRNTLHLRTAPLVLVAETALGRGMDLSKKPYPSDKPSIRDYTKMVIQRPDEMCAIISYIKNSRGQGLPPGIKRGIADAFNGFNEYSLQKYNTTNRQVKLRDVLMIVHPKPQSTKQSDMYKRLLEDNLAPADTWETKISRDGSNQTSWNEAVGVMPYMATLRNLRNLMIHDAGVEQALERIGDSERILNSKQFPYRFYSAHNQISECDTDPGLWQKQILTTLQKCLIKSVENMPHFLGTTAVFADMSGSMWSEVSQNSTVTLADIAALYTSMADSMCQRSVSYAFASDINKVTMTGKENIFHDMETIKRSASGGTYGYLAFKELRTKNIKVDRVILFTDMQIWDTWYGDEFQKEYIMYRDTINHDVKVYLVNLGGYGGIMMPEGYPNVYNIAGFSDNIFNFMNQQDMPFDVIEEQIGTSYESAKRNEMERAENAKKRKTGRSGLLRVKKITKKTAKKSTVNKTSP